MKCEKCGNKINIKDKFCEKCGAEVYILEPTMNKNYDVNLKIECNRCKNKVSNNLMLCPYCGSKLYSFKISSKNIKLLFKCIFFVLVIILGVFALTLFLVSIYNEDRSSTYYNSNYSEVKNINNTNNVNLDNNIKNESDRVEDNKKVYKINSKEYLKYINSIAESIYSKNNDMFGSCQTAPYSCTYYKIICYANKHYDSDIFNERVYEIKEYLTDELKQNRYKKGNIFTCNYDIVQLQLYNVTNNRYYPNDFKDYNVLDF